jgi:NAD+ synthase (glutamine-hydrolysing)
MGMTYDELTEFGRLRKVEKCGPYSMYTKLLQEWGGRLSPLEVRLAGLLSRMFGAELLRLLQIAYKVKNFFFEHARNRHKMLVTETFPR